MTILIAAFPWLAALAAFLGGLYSLGTSRLRRGPLTLRNRGMVWMIRWLALSGLMLAAAWATYSVGGCEDGFKAPARCTDIPDGWGDLAFAISFFTMIPWFYASPVALIFLAILHFGSRPLKDPEARDPDATE